MWRIVLYSCARDKVDLDPQANMTALSGHVSNAFRAVSRDYITFFPIDKPMTNKIKHTTRKRKNRNFAIPAAADAMPVNPNNAATRAMIKKIKAQRNI